MAEKKKEVYVSNTEGKTVRVHDRRSGRPSPRVVNLKEVKEIRPDGGNENLFIVTIGKENPCKIKVNGKDAELLREIAGLLPAGEPGAWPLD